MKNDMMMNTNNAETVDTLTTRKSEQNKARAAAEHAYSGRAWNVYNDIFAAYTKPSAAKVRAWDRCKALCAEFGGKDLIISGKSSMAFSAVFKYIERATGALCYCYITKDYTRHCYA